MTDDEWIKAIKQDEGRFPRLASMLWNREHQDDLPRKIKLHLAGALPLVVLGLATYFAMQRRSKRWAMSNPPLTRRKAITVGAIGSGLIATGRTADILTTREFLNRAAEAHAEIRKLDEFKELPSSVQGKLAPPIESYEANPLPNIGRIRTPAGAAKEAAFETALVTTILAAASRYEARKAEKRSNEPKGQGVTRRTFLSASAGMASASTAVAVGNAFFSTTFKEMPRDVQAELKELHSLMKSTSAVHRPTRRP